MKLGNKKIRNLALTGLIAGAASMSGCLFSDDDDSDAKKDSGEQSALVKEADFKSDCEAQGGVLEMLASCNGSATCAGKSLIDGVVKEHECAGHNDCAGLNCKIPA